MTFDKWWEQYKQNFGIYPHVVCFSKSGEFECTYCGLQGSYYNYLNRVDCIVKPEEDSNT